MKQSVYVVAGATATGKTALAVALAQRLGGEVISADSMQIYREMNIGTAKPTMEERQGIPHHMLDVVYPSEAYSVALYQQQAKQCIAQIHSKGKLPILAGGTGLYINSITHRLQFADKKEDTELRAELNALDTLALYDILKAVDEEAAARIHPNNKKRVVRAIEIAKLGKGEETYNFDTVNKEYDFRIIGLRTEREVLYANINQRVDKMLEQGLLAEAKYLYEKYGKEPVSMQGIGYKELVEYLEKQITLEDAVELVKRNTRRFAKRQGTWFRRDPRMVWYDIQEYETTQALAEKILQQQRSDER